MRITHYLYNCFTIESGDKKIAIDPGALFFYYLRFTSLIPRPEWNSITHILVTHGDPDHYWHTDRVAKTSHASVICNKSMVKDIGGNLLALGPRDRGLAFTTPFEKLFILSVGDTLEIDGMSITGIKTTHGQLRLKLGPFVKTVKPGPEERVGWGAIGFSIQLNGKTVVNLGDTLRHTKEWETINSPDVLMIPIGGRTIHNTMDEDEALQAVSMMHPKHVIPCHYNCPAFFTKKYNPANAERFKRGVEKTGAVCHIMQYGDAIVI